MYDSSKKVAKSVLRYQRARMETLKASRKILKIYGEFRPKWDSTFAPYLDNAGHWESVHDDVVLMALSKFTSERPEGMTLSSYGRNFKAYLVSTLINRLKDLRNKHRDRQQAISGNPFQVMCPVCRKIHELKKRVRDSHPGNGLLPLNGVNRVTSQRSPEERQQRRGQVVLRPKGMPKRPGKAKGVPRKPQTLGRSKRDRAGKMAAQGPRKKSPRHRMK
jgi:hypothetical protein